ncbi:MAG TPA: TonB-dependent receptor, partial [Polyangiaceae bacterium]|nr:TonB-dependent receptor [Polyangiaceae bacterium]
MPRRGDTLVSVLLLGLLSSSLAFGQFERAPEAVDTTDAGAPRVSPPRLLHFEPAVYPKEAEAAGLAAEVVLRLTVDERGAVTNVEVTQPAGHGFDQAASDAALRLTFEPALRNGAPIRARVLYRYSFKLSTAEPESKVASKATTGDFFGVLRVAGTESPLIGAEVVLLTPAGAEVTTRSDAQGQFSFAKLDAGTYRVRVTSPGFVPVESRETIVPNEATEVTDRATAAVEAGILEVTVVGERPLREVTRRTIERREIERIPGTSGDALRSLESMPGVARPPAFAGILVVRGSYPEDTQVYVDGSLIPLVYHFGGLRSVLPTELLERIDFYPGNYGAKYGRGMGGIVDVSLKSPETRCKDVRGNLTERRGCLNAVAQMDLIEGRVLLQGPLPVKGWSFAMGARRSWLDAWIGPVLESAGANARSLPVFSDYQFIVEHNRSNARTSLRFFGADDRFAAVVDPLAQEPTFGGSVRFGTSFMQGQVLHEQQLSSNISLSSLVTLGKTRVGFGIGSYKLDMVSHPFHWREELSFRVVRQLKFNTGFDFQVYPYDFSARSPNVPVPGQPTSGPFSSQPLLEASEHVTGVNQGWYIDAEAQPFDRLRVVPGLRLDYSRETRRTDVGPRLNVRYDLVPGAADHDGQSRRRTTFKGGIGYYHQAPQSQEINAVYGTPGLRSNRALHYSLGLEQELTNQLDVSLEGFYKHFDHLVAAGRPQDSVRYTNHGLGRSYGLETLVRYKPDRYFFGWIAYTLSRSERRDFPRDVLYLIPYDQTHNLTMLGSVRLGRGWEFGIRFRVISGSLTTPVRQAPSLP